MIKLVISSSKNVREFLLSDVDPHVSLGYWRLPETIGSQKSTKWRHKVLEVSLWIIGDSLGFFRIYLSSLNKKQKMFYH